METVVHDSHITGRWISTNSGGNPPNYGARAVGGDNLMVGGNRVGGGWQKMDGAWCHRRSEAAEEGGDVRKMGHGR
jgi:hypothetical protein